MSPAMSAVRARLPMPPAGAAAVLAAGLVAAAGGAVPPTCADPGGPEGAALAERWLPGLYGDARAEAEAWGTGNELAGVGLGRSSQYGEITAQGLVRVFDAIGDAGAALCAEDRFYDLGSGAGRAVLQAHLTTPVGRAVGVELVEKRHALAEGALQKLRAAAAAAPGTTEEGGLAALGGAAATAQACGREVAFHLGDIRTPGLWSDATVVYTNSICFPADLMLDLLGKLATRLAPGSLVFALQPFELPGCHLGLVHLTTLTVPTTWASEGQEDRGGIQVYAFLVTLRPPSETPRWLAPASSFSSWVAEESTAAATWVADGSSELVDLAQTRWSAASRSVALRLAAAAAAETPLGLPALLRHRRAGAEDSSVRCAWIELRAAHRHGGDDLARRAVLDAVGSSLDARDEGETLLSVAIEKHEVAIAALLLGARADPGAEATGPSPSPPLLHAALAVGRVKAAEVLIAHRAAVDSQDPDGWVALQYAARFGRVAVVELLLGAGATLGAGSPSSLELAAEHGHVGALRALLAVGSPTLASEPQGQAALLASDSAEVALELLARRASAGEPGPSGRQPLHEAARHGRAAVAEILLEARALPDAADGRGERPLCAAAEKGHLEVVQTLLGHRASASAAADQGEGRTPLHMAAHRGAVRIVEALLAAGADGHARDGGGRGPLHQAAVGGHAGAAAALIGARAALGSQDHRGRTALDLVSGTKVTKLLLLERADPNHRSSLMGLASLHWATLFDHKPGKVLALASARAQLDLTDNYGRTALHTAAAAGRPMVAAALLHVRASVDAPDANRETALEIAVEKGHSQVATVLLNGNASVASPRLLARLEAMFPEEDGEEAMPPAEGLQGGGRASGEL